ncbi:MAG: aspartate kinase [Bdellovibrionales bacterium]
MALIVVKFGGTSVGDTERIKNAAAKVAAEVKAGNKVAVVVSAMAGVTDQLIGYCRSVSPHYDLREYDAVVTSGENITAGLMAIALQQRGLNARSWQGWQVPMRTDGAHSKARILGVDAERLRARLDEGEIGVMAGFQGITDGERITTLGRGGSDTSAVALAIALKADRCDIYTDVDGVYTTDPRIVPKARKMKRVAYEEMLELASLGAKVLQTRSVELAMRYRMPVQVLSTFENAIGSELPGTLVTDGDVLMESNKVTGLAYSRNEAKVTLTQVADKPGTAASVFLPLARASVNIDMIVQTAAADNKTTEITFTTSKTELDRAIKVLEGEKQKIGYGDIQADSSVVKISLVGVGLRSHTGIAATMFETLAEKGINIQVIETSEISISVLIAEEYTELALRALHSAYGLDAKPETQESSAGVA